MNYIKLINQFWTSAESESYSTSDIALYFYLVKVSNDASWRNPFKRNNRKIEADLKINYRTLCNSRDKLKKNGLIDFLSTNGNANVTYILSLKDEVSSGGDIDTETDTEVSGEVNLAGEVGDEVASRFGRGCVEVSDEVSARLVTSEDIDTKVNTEVSGEVGDEVASRFGRGCVEVSDEVSARLVTSKDKDKLKLNNLPPIPPKPDDDAENWKKDFEVYLASLRKAYKSAFTDEKWLAERARYHPNLDIKLSLEKACKDYWALEVGWLHKRKSKAKAICWRSTFNSTLTLKNNQVYKSKNQNYDTNTDQGIRPY